MRHSSANGNREYGPHETPQDFPFIRLYLNMRKAFIRSCSLVHLGGLFAAP